MAGPPSPRASRAGLPPPKDAAKLIALVAIASCFIASTNLLVKASQVNGVTLYSKFSVTILSEAMKLLMSLATWAAEAAAAAPGRHRGQCGQADHPLDATDLLLFALPASLYVVVNNIKYPILERVDPGLLSVLWNGKIVSVALLLRLVFNKKLLGRQWAAVGLLVGGTTLAQISQWHWGARGSIGRTQVEGLLLIAFGIAVVSTANVSCEYVYKRTAEVPLWKQNICLYSLGIGLNMAAFAALEEMGGGFFRGFSGWVVLVIMSQGAAGFLVGMMFKYIDNIAAIYADVAAMLLSSLLASIYFGLVPNLQFLLSVLLSIISICLYYRPDEYDTAAVETCRAIEAEETELLLMPSDGGQVSQERLRRAVLDELPAG